MKGSWDIQDVGMCLSKSVVSVFLFVVVLGIADFECSANQNTENQVKVMSQSEGKSAIEKFMSVTALWIIELEWTFGYGNKTPNATERAKAMLAADVTTCPSDFQEAWLMQVKNPRRNYIAPVLRKYKVNLSDVRGKLQKQLRDIDSSINPPIPLYDEDEKPERFDPMKCGSRDNILTAIAKLRAKLNGFDPDQYLSWQKSIRNVMMAFTLSYMEIVLCSNAAGLDAEERKNMFAGIDTRGCPNDFIKAWKHDLVFFTRGDFGSEELKVPAMCKRYGVDETELLNFLKNKMREWEIKPPNIFNQSDFRKQYGLLRSNVMDYR